MTEENDNKDDTSTSEPKKVNTVFHCETGEMHHTHVFSAYHVLL